MFDDGNERTIWPRTFAAEGTRCGKWLPSPEYQASRGLMSPAVSNDLVTACKEFVAYKDDQRDVPVTHALTVYMSRVEGIRTALRSIGHTDV